MIKKRKWRFIKVKSNDDSILAKMQAKFWEELINEKFEKVLLEEINKTLGTNIKPQ